MIFDPTVLVLVFVAIVVAGSLAIYLAIVRRAYQKQPGPSYAAELSPEDRPLLVAEGLRVYRAASNAKGHPVEYHLDIDDQIIIAVHHPSRQQYAGIRCVLPEAVLLELATTVSAAAATRTNNTP